ncbi:MAG: hypothetical protein JO257_25770 [Deltaproteobacteria bacterium]|nr:hypothetical protein [Deltaproteobacteria bacterium]
MPDGRGLVRLAQLRGEIALLARGGRFDVVASMLGELARTDVALGLPADGILRARQAAVLAEERGEPVAGPLVTLAATLLAADAPSEALDAAAVATTKAAELSGHARARLEAMARLVGGAAQRRMGRLTEARVLLDAARGAAARVGAAAVAGLALAELGHVDLAEGRPDGAAACFEFAAEFLRRAKQEKPALEADVLCVAACAALGDPDAAIERAGRTADEARRLKRPELVAYLDGVLADLALAKAPDAAGEACALAAESAQALPQSPIARELACAARLRQVRATRDPIDRARHLEAGIDLAYALEPARASARLGAALADLLAEPAPARGELERLAAAIARVGDADLSEIAAAALAEVA